MHLGSKPTRVVLKVPPSVQVEIWQEGLTGRTHAAKGHVFPLDPMDVWILEGIKQNGGTELAGGSTKEE